MNSPNVSETQSTDESREGGTATAGSTKQKIKNVARETAAEIKHAAGSTITRAKEEAEKIATEKRSQAADRIGGYSSAIHDSARSLEEKDPNIAWITHRAADRLERVADYMRNRDARQLRADVEDIARRHPAAFFGGLFVAGLVIGNLLKASNRTSSSASAENGSTSDPGYGSSAQERAANLDNGRTGTNLPDLGTGSEALS
jgi:hypothetical protein